jgi:hypothetical protein
MRHVEYARSSYRDEFIDFTPRSYSHVLPRLTLHHVLLLSSLMDLTIAHMVLVHERITLSLDALVTAHVFPVVVTVFRIGLVFLLYGSTPTLNRDTWTVHVSPVVVHIPLSQMVRWKEL